MEVTWDKKEGYLRLTCKDFSVLVTELDDLGKQDIEFICEQMDLTFYNYRIKLLPDIRNKAMDMYISALQDHQFVYSNGEGIVRTNSSDRIAESLDNSEEQNPDIPDTSTRPTTKRVAFQDHQFGYSNDEAILKTNPSDRIADSSDDSEEQHPDIPVTSTRPKTRTVGQQSNWQVKLDPVQEKPPSHPETNIANKSKPTTSSLDLSKFVKSFKVEEALKNPPPIPRSIN